MKLGIIIGHTKAEPGTYSPHLGQYEYDWNADLAARIARAGGQIVTRIFSLDTGGVPGAYLAADGWGADLTVELHFNQSDNPMTSGCAVIYLEGSDRGEKWAKHLYARLVQVLGLPPWPARSTGIVTPYQISGKDRRGEASLKAGRAPAAVLEPFFGTNPADCAIAGKRKDYIAAAVAAAVTDISRGIAAPVQKGLWQKVMTVITPDR